MFNANRNINQYNAPTYANINNNKFPISYADATKNNSSNVYNNSNLFSANELLTLFNEMLISLKNCRSKEDQITILAQLTIKYIYGDSTE